MEEICVVVSNSNKNVNAYETIDAIKKTGYKNVFIQWFNRNQDISQEKQLEYIRKNKLNVLFAHLGYKNINDIWTEIGDYLVDYYKRDIDVCKENNINLVIMHLTSGFECPKYNSLGLKRIKKICDYAKEKNIKIAFENTKIVGYLEYVFDNINNDNIGVCFDSGHNHAFFNDEFDFERFKDKIFVVHLHDNHGEYDEHLLPYDGTIDWNDILLKLKKANYSGPIILEICYQKDYLNMEINDFYQKSHDIAIKLLKLIKK